MFMIEILGAFALVAVLMVAITEWSSYSVYGKWLKDEDIQEFYKEAETSGTQNSVSSHWMISLWNSETFMAKVALELSCKYYIDGVGRIPRWSKYTKMFDELYPQLAGRDFVQMVNDGTIKF